MSYHCPLAVKKVGRETLPALLARNVIVCGIAGANRKQHHVIFLCSQVHVTELMFDASEEMCQSAAKTGVQHVFCQKFTMKFMMVFGV